MLSTELLNYICFVDHKKTNYNILSIKNATNKTDATVKNGIYKIEITDCRKQLDNH